MNSKIYKMLADQLGGMPDDLSSEEGPMKKSGTVVTISLGSPEGEEEEGEESEEMCSECGKMPCEC